MSYANMEASTPMRGGRARRVGNLTKPAPLKRQVSADNVENYTISTRRVCNPAPENPVEKESEKENVKVPVAFSARKSSRKVKLEKPAPLKSTTIAAKIRNDGNCEKMVSPRMAETRASQLISEVVSGDVKGDTEFKAANPRTMLPSNTSVDSGLGDLEDGPSQSRNSSVNSYSRLLSSCSNYSSTSDYSRQYSTSSDYSRQTSSTSQDDIDWNDIDENPVPFALDTDQLKCLPHYVNQTCPFNSVSIGDISTDRKQWKHRGNKNLPTDHDQLNQNQASDKESVTCDNGDTSNMEIGNSRTETAPHSDTHIQSNSRVMGANCDIYQPQGGSLSSRTISPDADPSCAAAMTEDRMGAPVTDGCEAECVITDINHNAIPCDITGSYRDSELANNISINTKPARQAEIVDSAGSSSHDKFKESLYSMIPKPVSPFVQSPSPGHCQSEIMDMYNTRADVEADKSPMCLPSPPELKNDIRESRELKVVKIREPLCPTSTLKDIWEVEETLPCGLYSVSWRRKMFRNYAVCRQEEPECSRVSSSCGLDVCDTSDACQFGTAYSILRLAASVMLKTQGHNKKTSLKHHVPSNQPEEKARIQYTADALLELGTSPLCRQLPDCWSYLVTIFPHVCLPQMPANKCLNTEWYRQERQYVVEQYNVMPQKSIQPQSAGDQTKRVRFQFPPPDHMSTSNHTGFGSTNSGGFGSTNSGGFGSTNSGGFGSTNTGFGSTNSGGFGSTNSGSFGSSNSGGFGSTNSGGFGSTNSGGFGSTNTGFGSSHVPSGAKAPAVDLDTKCDISVRRGMNLFPSSTLSTPGFMRQHSCPALGNRGEPWSAQLEPDYKIMDFRERQRLEQSRETDTSTNVSNNASNSFPSNMSDTFLSSLSNSVSTSVMDNVSPLSADNDIIMNKELPEKCPW